MFRGTVLAVERRGLTLETRRLFTTELAAPILAVAELYGSNLVAALDRQHPRDLFDVHGMFEAEGMTPEVVECFVCYLAGHNRPVHEVLFSRDQDIAMAFEYEFSGMARLPVTLATMLAVRNRLRRALLSMLTVNHCRFLESLVSGEPEWALMNRGHLSELPAIRWKLDNLAKLKRTSSVKFAAQADALRSGSSANGRSA